MTPKVIKRVRYFFGKLLKKEDFEEEQNYHLNKKRSKYKKVEGTGVSRENIKKPSVKKETDS